MLVEAYALFMTDSTFVQGVSPALYNWFMTKEFLISQPALRPEIWCVTLSIIWTPRTMPRCRRGVWR